MKKLTLNLMQSLKFICLSLLVFSCSVFNYTESFKTTDIPTKDDNVITIKTHTPAEENYNLFTKHLISKGYTFESTNREFLLIKTNPKSNGGAEAAHRLSANFVDTDIIIRIEYSSLSMASFIMYEVDVVWYDWRYTSISGSMQLLNFKHFFPNIYSYSTNIIFSKE